MCVCVPICSGLLSMLHQSYAMSTLFLITIALCDAYSLVLVNFWARCFVFLHSALLFAFYRSGMNGFVAVALTTVLLVSK